MVRKMAAIYAAVTDGEINKNKVLLQWKNQQQGAKVKSKKMSCSFSL